MRQSSSGSLDPQGPVAETIADLWWLMLGLGLAVLVVVFGATVLVMRAMPTADNSRVEQVHRVDAQRPGAAPATRRQRTVVR